MTFLQELERVEEQYLDTAFAGERLRERPDLLLALLLELVESSEKPTVKEEDSSRSNQPSAPDLEFRLLEAVGGARRGVGSALDAA